MAASKRLLVGCNILSTIDGRAYAPHCQFWYNAGRKLPNYDILFNSPIQSSIDRMRNSSAKLALEFECEYLFFYDVDVLTPATTLYRLLEKAKRYDYDVLCGLTYIRGYPFHPMLFKFCDGEVNGKKVKGLTAFDDFEDHIDEESQIVDCPAVGFSCALLKCETLKKIESPYFVTGTRNTEDVYYCMRLMDEIEGVKIGCDTSVECGHIVDRYWVNRQNRDKLIQFEEEVFQVVPSSSGDRDKKYMDACHLAVENAKK